MSPVTTTLTTRVSDVVQLAKADLALTSDALRITFRRDKTVGHTGPYTLWLPKSQFSATALATLLENDTTGACPLGFFLSATNDDQERAASLDVIRLMLQPSNEDLELRSIRRGGETLASIVNCTARQ